MNCSRNRGFATLPPPMFNAAFPTLSCSPFLSQRAQGGIFARMSDQFEEPGDSGDDGLLRGRLYSRCEGAKEMRTKTNVKAGGLVEYGKLLVLVSVLCTW